MHACSSNIYLFCCNIFNSLIYSGSRSVVPSTSACTFEQNISNLNCLPTNSIANTFDAILDVVSLEKSKEL